MIVYRTNLKPSALSKPITDIKAYDLNMPIKEFEKETEVWFFDDDGTKIELRTKHVKILFLVFFQLSKPDGGTWVHHHTRTCLPHLREKIESQMYEQYFPRVLGFTCKVYEENPFNHEPVKHHTYVPNI